MLGVSKTRGSKIGLSCWTRREKLIVEQAKKQKGGD